jgi:hypothetical protein
MQRVAGLALLYFIIAWAFHAGSINPFTQLIGGGDGFIQGFPSKLYSISLSPWNPFVQAGKYVYADVLYQSFYPPNLIIFSLFPNTLGFNLYLLIHYALAGLFMYLYLGSLRLTTYSAFVGGLIFMTCGFLCAHKGHEYIICSAIWSPLTLYFVQRYAERQRLISIGWAAIPLGLSILAGFPQVTLYSSLVILAYLTYLIFHSDRLRGWKAKLARVLLVAFVLFSLALLLGCLPLFAVAESLPYLTRERLTYQMFTSDSFPPWQLLTFLIPNLFGGVNRHVPTYGPGTTVFAAEVYPYIGMLPLAFAIYCFIARRALGAQAKFWIGVTVVALILSFGGSTAFYRLLFHLPVYNLFRVPARHLFEVDLALSVLAALGLDHFLANSRLNTKRVRRLGGSDSTELAEVLALPDSALPRLAQAKCPLGIRPTLITFSLLVGSALLIAAIFRSLTAGLLSRLITIPDTMVLNYYYQLGDVRQAIAANLSWQNSTILLPTLFFAVTGALLLWMSQGGKNVIPLIAIPVVLLADTFVASYRMYDNPSTDSIYLRTARPELDFLDSQNFDKVHYRIFPVDFDIGSTARLTSTYHLLKTYPYPLLNTFNGLPVINDYGPFWLKRYQAITGFGAGGTMPAVNLQNQKMLSILGTRYLMTLSPESKRSIEGSETSGAGNRFYSVATMQNGIVIFANPQALPRFRFAKRIIPARDPGDASRLMNDSGFDPSKDAIVEGATNEESLANAKILSEQVANTWLNFDVEAEGRSFFIVADSFFPGWIASIDGKPTSIFPVYGCVRGIWIETAGKHRVEFRFVPKTLFCGVLCTSLGILLLGLLWLADITVRKTRPPFDLSSGDQQFHR